MVKDRDKFEEVDVEMTPMIDVTFLLLIFFIVTLKFKTLEGRLDAALPKDRGTSTSQAEEVEKVDIVIKVLKEGQLVTDPENKRLLKYVGRTVSMDVGTQSFRDAKRMKAFLKSFDKEETPVTIDARKGITYGDVVIALDVVIELGFQQIAFAGSFENE